MATEYGIGIPKSDGLLLSEQPTPGVLGNRPDGRANCRAICLHGIPNVAEPARGIHSCRSCGAPGDIVPINRGELFRPFHIQSSNHGLQDLPGWRSLKETPPAAAKLAVPGWSNCPLHPTNAFCP